MYRETVFLHIRVSQQSICSMIADHHFELSDLIELKVRAFVSTRSGLNTSPFKQRGDDSVHGNAQKWCAPHSIISHDTVGC